MGKRKRKKTPYTFKPPKLNQQPKSPATNEPTDIPSGLLEPISEKPRFWGRLFPSTFYYPVSSPRNRFLWFFLNSVTFWIIIGFGTCRFIWGIPDYSLVPKPMLGLAGNLIMFAGVIHIMMIVRLSWTAVRYRYVTKSFIRLMAAHDTFGKILSSTGIIIILIYAYGAVVVNGFSNYLYKYFPSLGEQLIHFLSYSFTTLVSIVTGVVSNIIYASLVKRRRRARIQKHRESQKKD